MLEKKYLEEHAPVLAFIATNLVSNPKWSLKLLETTTQKLFLPMHRMERDTAVDLFRAIEAGLEVMKYCPTVLVDMLRLAHLLAQAERLEESLQWIDKVIELESDVADHHRLRASLLERLKRYSAGYQASKRALLHDSGNIDLIVDSQRLFKKMLFQKLGILYFIKN